MISLALAEPALSLSQYRMLNEFSEQKTLTVSELSTRLVITKPSVTQLVKQLKSMGLINIKSDANDQRSKRLTLTREGKLRLKIANEYLAALEKRLAKNCTPEQLSALRSLEIRISGS
jgi:DNA-binding MarR family transcriptional regulator